LPASDSRRPVGSSPDNLIESHLAGVSIGQTDNDHAEMHEVGDDRKQRRFVAAVLRRARGECPADLSVQGTFPLAHFFLAAALANLGKLD
jgi:hypothetical protein